MDSLTTGKFIAKLRKEKKLTQSELADLLQVTDKAISRWETGEGLPEVSLLPNLARILNVTVDELLDGARKQEKQQENMDLNNKKDLIRFNNHALLSLLILIAGYMLSVALVYLTRKEWVALIAFIPVTLVSVAYYMFQRVNFLVECNYTDDDKKSIFKNTRNLYFTGIVTFMLLMPLLIDTNVKVGIGTYVHGIMTFRTYFQYAFSFGLLGFFMAFIVSMIHFRKVYGKKKYQGFFKRFGWLILGEVIVALFVPYFLTGKTSSYYLVVSSYYLLIELSIDLIFCLVLFIMKINSIVRATDMMFLYRFRRINFEPSFLFFKAFINITVRITRKILKT
jgi:transcriptional regulator with XRE-family HTH domain